MIKPTGVVILLGVLTSAAAASPGGAAFTQINGVWQRDPHGCGTPQRAAVLDNALVPPPAPAVGLRTVYLNRKGGTYTVGTATDAAANRVSRSIIDMIPNGSTFTIPPLNTAMFNWTNISACVRNHFRRFNIAVIEQEPAPGTQYIEAVVGGTGQEIGFGPGELFGIASADNFCNVTERGIAFNFSDTHLGVPRRDEELCATIAHEVGHLIALEHEQLPADLMSYVLVNDSGTKAFVNQTSNCGTSPQDRSPCSCSTTSTNSYGRLSTFIGLRTLEMNPPTVTITAPGDVVPPTFDVVVTATDDVMMSDVFALIDGVEASGGATPQNDVYTMTVQNVSEGTHQLSVIAYDAAANMTRKDVTITVKKLATGEVCVANADCTGNVCAMSSNGNFCTQTCDPAADTCPDGFACSAVGGGTVCVPADDGGCCSTSRRPAPAILLGLGVGALLLRRRRR